MSAPDPLAVRPAGAGDRETVAAVLEARWAGTGMVSRGRVHDAASAPAFVAERNGTVVGLATYERGSDGLELLSLDALEEGAGVGTALLEAVVKRAADLGERRVVLATTNDNLRALAFYRRRGFSVVAIHRGAVDRARELKPAIPLIGRGGVEIHDEIVLARGVAGPATDLFSA